MAHYLFNFMGDVARGPALREQAVGLLRVKMWAVDVGEPHRDTLGPGDLVVIYLAPDREFIGRAELASAARDWTASEAQMYPGDSRGGVLLSAVEEWDPAVPIDTVLSRIDTSAGARADFENGVVGITADEYATVLTVAAGGPHASGSSGN